MAIAPAGGASGHNGNDNFATVAYTPTSTSNILVFTLSIDNDAAATLSVDDNGGGHSAAQQAIVTNTLQRVAIFTMTPPSTGALTFKGLSSVASQDVVICVEEYSGVSSIGNTGTKTGSTSPMNVDVVMQDPNNYVVGGFASRGTAAPTTGNPGTFRQGAFDNAVDREASGLADNTSASTGSLNVGLTIPGGDFTWAAVGVELRAGAAIPTTLWAASVM